MAGLAVAAAGLAGRITLPTRAAVVALVGLGGLLDSLATALLLPLLSHLPCRTLLVLAVLEVQAGMAGLHQRQAMV